MDKTKELFDTIIWLQYKENKHEDKKNLLTHAVCSLTTEELVRFGRYMQDLNYNLQDFNDIAANILFKGTVGG